MYRHLSLILGPMLLIYPAITTATTSPTAPPTESSVTSSRSIEQISSIGGSINIVAVRDDYAFVGEGVGLTILDVTNIAQPRMIDRVLLGERISSVTVANTMVYVGTDNGRIFAVDVSQPDRPALRSTYGTSGSIVDIEVAGGFAYAVSGGPDGHGLLILDVAVPTQPVLRGQFPAEDGRAVDVVGSAAYLATEFAGLKLIDVRNPEQLALIGQYNPTGSVQDVEVIGNLAYIPIAHAQNNEGLEIVDISNQAQPTLRGRLTLPTAPNSVYVSGNNAYVTNGGLSTGQADRSLYVVDVSNPAAPQARGSYQGLVGPNNVQVVDNVAYIADGRGGLHLIDVASQDSPSQVGSYITIGSARAIRVVQNTAYVLDADLMGRAGPWTLRVIDVHDLTHPVVVGSYRGVGTPRDIAVVGQTAYIANGFAGLEIVDVSNPTFPTLRANVDTPGIAVDVEVTTEFAYVADGNGGLRVVDIRNLHSPVLRGSYSAPGGDATRVEVAGSFAYVDFVTCPRLCFSSVHIIDTSNADNPSQAGTIATSPSTSIRHVEQARAYVTAWETGFEIVDVANHANPTVLGGWQTPFEGGATVNQIDVDQNLAYVATSSAGLQVIDVRYPQTPRLRAHFEAGDAMDVLASDGIVYVADGRQGLQILRINPANFPPLVFLPQVHH